MSPYSPISIHALTRRATTNRERTINRFQISIHALTRRATDSYQDLNFLHAISIHALTRRATYEPINNFIKKRFQFTLSRGERRCRGCRVLLCSNFNSRSHEESDTCSARCHIVLRYFNSRSHEESDNRGGSVGFTFWDFNSRSHEESDC